MRLYALRHGETSWNVQRRFQGQSDIPLNDKGILLAELTGEGLANIPFDLAFTSPLCRARQTAELVLADGTYRCTWNRGSSKWRSASTRASRPTPARVGR